MILDRLMPSCREVTRCLAEGEFEKTPWLKRLLMRLHISMCEHCGRFARQLELISKAFREMWKGGLKPEALEAAKRRILSRFK